MLIGISENQDKKSSLPTPRSHNSHPRSDDMEPKSYTNPMKREIQAPKRYDVIHALGCIAIVAPCIAECNFTQIFFY
jgi:hypothetical protein